MALTPGTRFGPYEVTAQIGVGGMGEVYKATDTNLKRAVAIKVLPASVAADVERLARFQREAEVLASLNHPNIAAIYGLERTPGMTALVMELVEGPTLADRIAQGAIPIDEALPLAKQIAEALEAAHEQGIIHRDLKPANIKVRPDGTVKVLDFGLAKAMEPTGAMSPSVSQSPTITTPALVTGAGMILGTAAYMSPEQARGKTVDKRTDIWAFGAVLFEMLTGKRAFEGADVAETLARVIERQPDFSALPRRAPSSILRLLRRTLAKDLRMRLPDVAVARIEIDEALTEPATISSAAVDTGLRTRWIIALVSIVSAIVAVTLTVFVLRVLSPQPVSPGRSGIRLELNLPAGVEFYAGSGQSAALSADGTRVAFVGLLGGIRQIYLRRLDQLEAVPLRGTETATDCFFSPDGLALGFLTAGGGGLKKVSLADGLVVPLTVDADFNAGGAWGTDDRITFVRAGALWQVPAAGGGAAQLTRLDRSKGELSHVWPTVAADGKVLLLTVLTGRGRGAAHIEALTLATGQRKALVDPGTFPLYAPSGHLMFFRNDAVLATVFDVDRLAVTGQPIRILEDLAVGSNGSPMVALSPAGSLVYAAGGTATSRLVWVSREGVEQPVTDAVRRYTFPRLAPDGRQVLVTANGDLWVQDTARATFTRLTSNQTAGNSFAVWTPDAKRVVFRTPIGLQWIDADGSGRSEPIPGTSMNDYPNSVSPDGTTLAFIRITGDTSADVYALSLQGEPQPRAIVKESAYEGGAQFSPDGRWLAYVSDESGQFQVYVRPFPGPDRRWPVSTQGGGQPRWNRNGKELFYRNGNTMMVVDVLSTNPELILSPPRLLFDQRYAFGTSLATPNYDVSLDGQRFVMVKDESSSGRLNVVLNWFDELKRLVPTN